MPKHKTNDPRLQELYNVIRDCEGVEPIDGRSTSVLYVANVQNLEHIVNKLTLEYGVPAIDHPLLGTIEWEVRSDFRIHVDKADSLSRGGTLHHIYAFSF